MSRLTWGALTLIALTGISSQVQASEQDESQGFIEDAHAKLFFRNLYFSRDFKSSRHEGQSKRMNWAQGITGTFDSGFTQGTVGFGVDAFLMQGIRLDGGRGHANPAMDIAPVGDSGKAAHDWSKGGAAIKMRISNTTVRFGNQFVSLPVLNTDTTRLLPEDVTGLLITSREIEDLEVNAGHFTANRADRATGHDNTGFPDAAVVGMKEMNLIGGTYTFSDKLSASLYYADNQDIVKRGYGNLNWVLPIADEQSLTFDYNIYHSKYDKKYVELTSDGEYNSSKDNTTWSFSTKYTIGAHGIIAAYQQSKGGWDGHGFDYGSNYGTNDGNSTIFLANSFESDFNGKDEKSFQIGYELDGAKIGVPGFALRTAYVYGWDADMSSEPNGRSGKERELFNLASYTIQSGSAKDLTFRLRTSFLRTQNRFAQGADNNEVRLYIDYPLNIL